MPRKLIELMKDLTEAGFYEFKGGRKEPHRKYGPPQFQCIVTLSGHSGDDAKHYQEKQVKSAIENISK
jgi:hypothetical protein